MGPANRRLMWHGILLFLLGLVTGLLDQRFTNMRMGVSAHLEGVMNGIFLIAVGAIWNEVRLSPPAKMAAFRTALYGTYANWVFTTLGAVLGTAAANPISAAGHHGQPWQESLVGAGFLSVAHFVLGEDLEDRAVIDRHASNSGVDLTTLHPALEDGSAARFVTETEMTGRKFGVQGTPAWLLDQRLITGLRPAAEFERLAEYALQVRH